MKNNSCSQIKASVFMPVYNSSRYLDESIQSIMNQNHSNFEFIIIDDGSEDNSVSIIENYAKKDERITFKERKHRGLPITRNEGLEIASGKYFLPMDSDDISFPDRLSTQISFMERNPDVIASGANMAILHSAGKIKRHPQDHDTIKVRLLFNSAINHPCSIIRLDALKKHNIRYLESDTFAHDYRLWVSLSRYGKLANIDKKLGQYRQHKDQVSQKKKHIQYAVAKSVVRSQLQELSVDHLEDELDILLIDTNRDFDLIPKIDTKYLLRTTHSLFSKILIQNDGKNLFDKHRLIKHLYRKYSNVCLMFQNDGLLFFKKNRLKGSSFLYIKYRVLLIFRYLYRNTKQL